MSDLRGGPAGRRSAREGDARDPVPGYSLLKEDDGTVWRLEGEVAMEILLDSVVVLTAVQAGAKTLEVRSFEVLDSNHGSSPGDA